MIQSYFTVVSIVLGWQFYRFAEAAKSASDGILPHRPPGVEGYLPISGLMGALDWIYQGTLNTIHPAATILLLLFVIISFILRKSFCGWICPVGFLSEWLGRLGVVLFKRSFRLYTWADILLCNIKYLILAFFSWAIFTMSPESLRQFIESPYNKISDIKMMDFFVQLSIVGGSVLIVLVILSVFVQGFWCRYFCPYGALLGLTSWLSPVKVRRNIDSCTDCGICDKICPARLPVMSKKSISDPECIGCFDCVTSCPVPDTLSIGKRENDISSRNIASAIIILFFSGYIAARSFGIWQNQLTDEEIRYHVSRMNSPEYAHPR
ncbi:MAG: 4Fe-4S binding protein [Candidatus Electryonea clarkiae]|nr:4Fe-4S binding protein [Candidatus Electryonea clarkiae]